MEACFKKNMNQARFLHTEPLKLLFFSLIFYHVPE